MYEQLDIFSLMQTQPEEPPILLTKGQTVYLVNKADFVKCTASGETWIYGDCERGYRLIRESGLYGVTNNEELGETAFTDCEQARQKADEYLKSHDGIILGSDIKPISTVAYSYIRDCENWEMTAFYCDLGNDMYYIKEFMTYHHIIKGKNTIKKFMEQQEFKYDNPKKIDGFVPHFKNMYKCTEHSDWDYAECGYTYVVG